MSIVNVLIGVHGMTPNSNIYNPALDFAFLFDSICRLKPEINDFERIYVTWGHQIQSTITSPDQRLTKAQDNVAKSVSTSAFLDPIHNDLKQKIILFGFPDVIYFASEDGNKNVLKVVYEQIFSELNKIEVDKKPSKIAIHILGHSAGVAVVNEVLYGLFKKDYEFMKNDSDFIKWKTKIKNNELVLASLTSMASQLPLFVFRFQRLVDKFYLNEKFDPSEIGFDGNSKSTKWNIFYDNHDLLGFPTKELFYPNKSIEDIEVNSGWYVSAHTGYFKTQKVIEETASLISYNIIEE